MVMLMTATTWPRSLIAVLMNSFSSISLVISKAFIIIPAKTC